jgi:epidermal growth factor receptor substrate 15
MFEKSPYISTNQNMKEEDPIEKLNLSLNQLIFSLKNKEAFSSTDIDVSLNSNNEEEDIEKIGDNEGEELLNQFENLNNINKNNNISDEKLNEKIDNKVNKKNFDKNKNIFLEKLKEIKNKNSEFKNEIKEYQNIFNEMIKIVANGVMMKESEMNDKYQNIVNKLLKDLELSKQKINKIDIDYKKRTNYNLQKFNNIINNNKIQKEQIEKNFQESIDNLEQEKNKLIEEKNNLIEEQKNKNIELNKLNDELISLEKEKQNITKENEKLKTEINELNQNIDIINKNNEENIEKIILEKEEIINQLTQDLEKANTKMINQNKLIEKSKIKIEELEKWKKETKIILKQYEKEKFRLNELEKIFNQFQN